MNRTPIPASLAVVACLWLGSAGAVVRAQSGGGFSADLLQLQSFPADEWERIDRPEAAGYDPQRLDILREWLRTSRTTAMLVSVGGKVLFEYGDTSRVSDIASIRKSVVAMLYGNYVADGTIDLDQTVVQVGLDDLQPFLGIERESTLLQLLTGRSGIYLPSNDQDSDLLSLPRRGSQVPGTYFQYHEWDFNAASAAFEILTGRDLYDSLEVDLAVPLGFQDFDLARHEKVSAMPDSKHPAYPMSLSTRDMARLGLLMLEEGHWQGRQLIPAEWVRRMTRLVTPQSDLHPTPLGVQTWSARWGFGMSWWVWDAPRWPGVVTGAYDGAYTAMGAHGQYITVLPVLDMVVAHKVDLDETGPEGLAPEILPYQYDAILQMLIAAGLD